MTIKKKNVELLNFRLTFAKARLTDTTKVLLYSELFLLGEYQMIFITKDCSQIYSNAKTTVMKEF